MTPPPAAYHLQNLRFAYPASTPIFPNLSLTIPSAAVTAILGPNGCGKTTLLLLLLGYLRPLAGSLSLFGQPLTPTPSRLPHPHIGFVPQTESMPFDFSLLDYVLLGRAPAIGPFRLPRPADLSAARAALAHTGLLPLAPRPVSQLSGGERQLAAISRVLLQHPRVILLDEPTAHLDPANRNRIQRLMTRLAHQNHLPILFSSHDPALAATADHAILLAPGHLLASGPAPSVLTTHNLSALYHLPIPVLTTPNGRLLIQS